MFVGEVGKQRFLRAFSCTTHPEPVIGDVISATSSSTWYNLQIRVTTMDDSILIEVDWTDFSRESMVPLSNFFFWSQRCRHGTFAEGLLGEIMENMEGMTMVKAQHHHLTEPYQFGVSTKLEVRQRLSSVGRTSLTLINEFFADGKYVAYGHVAIVAAKNGKVTEIPKQYVDSLTKSMRPDPHSNDLKQIAAFIAANKEAPIQAELEVLFRSSDEDMNYHVNQARYAQVFEDALRLVEDIPTTLLSLSCDYLKEAKRGQTCVVRVRRVNATSAILQLVCGEHLICTGLATWKPSHSI